MSASTPFGAFVRKARPAATRRGERPAQADAAGPGADAAADGLPADLVEVGVIADSYGVKGWIKVFPHAQGGDALLAARVWWLERDGAPAPFRVESARRHVHTIVAQLQGCGDRNQALALKGHRVHVRRADFGAPAENEYYWVDLIGKRVVNEAGVDLGTVADLLDNGAHSVLRVAHALPGDAGGAGERLIPFVDAYVRSVDLAAGLIVVDWEPDY
jgi:16S rRNA processing protein RimM